MPQQDRRGINLSEVTLVHLEQTCEACPSQWDGWDAEGTYYYIRYRWGHLSVQNLPCALNTYVYREQHGNDLDGFMTTEDMLRHTGLTYASA